MGELHPSGRDPSVDKLLEEFSDPPSKCICVSAFHAKAGCQVHNPAPQHRRVRDAVDIPRSKGQARRMGVGYDYEPLIRREDVIDESGQVDPRKVREAAVRKKKEILEEYLEYTNDHPVPQFSVPNKWDDDAYIAGAAFANIGIRTDELWRLIFDKYRLLDAMMILRRRDEIIRLFDSMINYRQVGLISDEVFDRYVASEEQKKSVSPVTGTPQDPNNR